MTGREKSKRKRKKQKEKKNSIPIQLIASAEGNCQKYGIEKELQITK